jgi:hypothetical protein
MVAYRHRLHSFRYTAEKNADVTEKCDTSH